MLKLASRTKSGFKTRQTNLYEINFSFIVLHMVLATLDVVVLIFGGIWQIV